MKFIDVRKRHIQGVIDASPLKYQAKSHMKSLCGQMFKLAIDLEIVTTNFASLVEMPPHEASKIHKPFTEEELQILWNNTDDIGARIALILCYTGLRPTELIEIKTQDIHLEDWYMRGGIKTAAGKNRIIPIAEKIYPFIEQMYNRESYSLNIFDYGGNQITSYQRLLCHLWKKSPVLNSLAQKHLPHDGRHTCATLLDNAEVPLKIRQMILGHSSTDITNQIYTHKTTSQLIDAINRI